MSDRIDTQLNLNAPGTAGGLALIQAGAGAPEGVVTAPPGSLYLRTDGTSTTTLYVKDSGSGNTGWSTSNDTALAPKMRQPVPAASRQILTQFQSGHGFTKLSGTGTATLNDTTDFQLGTQSVKFVTAGDGGSNIFQKNSVGPYDLTGKMIQITFKLNSTGQSPGVGALNIGDLSFYLSSDNQSTTNGRCAIMGATKCYSADGEWVTIVINWGDLIFTGSPTRSAINSLKFRIQDANATPISVAFQEIALIPEPANAVCSIVIDDGYDSTWTMALPYLESKGLRCGIAVIRDRIGLAGYLTLAQLKMAQDRGHDIYCHADTIANHNLGFGLISDAAAEQEMRAIKAWMITNGFRRHDVFIWPKGSFTASQMAIAKKYFSCMRGTAGGEIAGSGVFASYPPGDPNRLQAWLPGATDTAVMATNACTQAINNKQWLNIAWHLIVTSGASGAITVNQSVFNASIDNIVSSGVRVRTIADVFENGVA